MSNSLHYSVMDPQPTFTEYTGVECSKFPQRHFWRHDYEYERWQYRDAPHAPGDVVPVREEWRPVRYQGGTGMYEGTVSWHVEYKTNEGELLQLKLIRRCDGTWAVSVPPEACLAFVGCLWFGRKGRSERWQPAATMPDWAVRRHVRILSIRPVRASEVTEAEAERLGFSGEIDPCVIRPSTQLERAVGGPGTRLWVWEEEEEIHASKIDANQTR